MTQRAVGTSKDPREHPPKPHTAHNRLVMAEEVKIWQVLLLGRAIHLQYSTSDRSIISPGREQHTDPKDSRSPFPAILSRERMPVC